MIDWEELQSPQADSLPESRDESSLGKVAPAAAAPYSEQVCIHLLEDEIARLRRWLDELVRMHYRLDEQPEGVTD